MTLTVVYVEGNIGVGKSTLIHMLDEKPWILRNQCNCDLLTLQEPVDLWRESGALTDLYSKQINNSLFQMMVLATRSASIVSKISKTLSKNRNEVLIIERGLNFGDKAFANVSFENSKEKALYDTSVNVIYKSIDETFKNLDRGYKKVYVYLKLDPNQCLERIKKRGRTEEGDITIDYLKNLDESHESFKNDLTKNKERIVELDANAPPQQLVDEILNIIKTVRKPRSL